MRQNFRPLTTLLLSLSVTIVVFTIAFRLIMLHVEGREYSWITSAYWTLTVMSTLGFGDITFQSDVGRAFSLLVLLTGLVLLLVVLPFAFIRFFYAPWLEARLRLRAPRQAPADVTGHVVICRYDGIAQGLILRLDHLKVPYFVLEPDPSTAGNLHADGVHVIAAEVDARSTYEAVRAEHARLIVANSTDADNTNITLTVREHAPKVPIAAIAEATDSVEVLELAGATAVLPLKNRLGEHLASRVNAGNIQAHIVGRFRDLLIAEFPVHNTPLAGRPIRDTHVRQLTGITVVAYWDRGRLYPADADTVLGDYSVAVVVGTEDQITELNALFVIYRPNENPVLVIGGGQVGYAATQALRARDVAVHVIERNPEQAALVEGVAARVFVGDAAERTVLERAGLLDAPSVVLTTNDDATNIFLAVYCRRLNPDTRIVSRISRERNLEAIHRAGADFVLSYDSLGIRSLLALVHHREPIILGEGADLYVVPVPEVLGNRTLAESAIGARTGLHVIAMESGGKLITNPPASARIPERGELVLIGTMRQRLAFTKAFGV